MKPFTKERPDKSTAKRKLALHLSSILGLLGADSEDPSIKDTPNRVAKMYVEEIFSSLWEDPPKLTTQPKEDYNGPVIIKDIEFTSYCEHHLVPFIGKATVAYTPNKLVGLSKFNRVVNYFAKRPQVQERLTSDIFNFLSEELGTTNIYVKLEAEHFCVKIRGIKDQSSKTITVSSGTYDSDDILLIERLSNG